jgi:hypothetical protein
MFNIFKKKSKLVKSNYNLKKLSIEIICHHERFYAEFIGRVDQYHSGFSIYNDVVNAETCFTNWLRSYQACGFLKTSNGVYIPFSSIKKIKTYVSDYYESDLKNETKN